MVEMSVRQPSFVYPPELTMLPSEWQFAQRLCTLSLPAPSGRLTGGPPRPRCPAIGSAVMRRATQIESESSCLFIVLTLEQEKREKREKREQRIFSRFSSFSCLPFALSTTVRFGRDPVLCTCARSNQNSRRPKTRDRRRG